MLRLERKGVREVRLEIGGALARNAVDEIERDVVEPGITESMDRPSDVVGAGTRSSTPSRCGLNDCAPSETRLTRWSRSSKERAGVTVSGLASTVTSAAGGSASSVRMSASGSVKVGVPPPTNTVSSGPARTRRSRSSSARSAST